MALLLMIREGVEPKLTIIADSRKHEDEKTVSTQSNLNDSLNIGMCYCVDWTKLLQQHIQGRQREFADGSLDDTVTDTRREWSVCDVCTWDWPDIVDDDSLQCLLISLDNNVLLRHLIVRLQTLLPSICACDNKVNIVGCWSVAA